MKIKPVLPKTYKFNSYTDVRIDRGIQKPEKPPNPFDDMEIDDSFAVSIELHDKLVDQITGRNRRKDGKRFVYRSSPYEVRCWRVE